MVPLAACADYPVKRLALRVLCGNGVKAFRVGTFVCVSEIVARGKCIVTRDEGTATGVAAKEARSECHRHASV
jgi:hypothetical protein